MDSRGQPSLSNAPQLRLKAAFISALDRRGCKLLMINCCGPRNNIKGIGYIVPLLIFSVLHLERLPMKEMNARCHDGTDFAYINIATLFSACINI